jgi:hypothetical protein
MAIQCPPCFGIMVRKNSRTQPFIERSKAHLLNFLRRKDPGVTQTDLEDACFQDEHLFASTVAMNSWNLEESILAIESEGCVRGVDFLVTSSHEGVLDDPLPSWVSVELRQVTVSREQLASMDPIFREALERQGPKMARYYSFVTDR